VRHEPVMAAEVIAAMVTGASGSFVDLTVGDGGHARAILDASAPGGRLLGLDRDAQAITTARANLADYGQRVHLAQDNFSRLREQLAALGWGPVDGVLLDLGLRSSALDDPARGFSFRVEGPLDMRFDPTCGETAAQWLARVPPDTLQGLLAEGTSRADPRRIARGIVEWRRLRELKRTTDLVACLRACLGRWATPKLLASVFATVRMAVNAELEALERALETIPAVMNSGGVLCVLSYQSQEDRRVKQLARMRVLDSASATPYRMISLLKRPQRPTREETRRNPRAASARLRVLRKTAVPPPS
jgi:16S rRNA (cytosine1402-N4)-methyltransferase